jgi:serine acetyltransferase
VQVLEHRQHSPWALIPEPCQVHSRDGCSGDPARFKASAREGVAVTDDGDADDADRADGDGEGGSRMDGLDRVYTGATHNSFRGWYRRYNPLRVMLNYAVIVLCRHSPSLRLKRWLLRRIGVTVGPGAVFALESTPDVFFPHLITVETRAIIGYDATILCHEFLQDEVRTGEVVVREGAMIGAGAILLPGVEIGEDAQVAANSLVAEDVHPGETVAGVPAEPVT